MTNRREFIKKAAIAGAISSIPGTLLAKNKLFESGQRSSDDLIWSILIHLGRNHGNDHIPEEYNYEINKIESCDEARKWSNAYRRELTFDESIWNDVLNEISGAGMNMLLIDLEDGIRYESHPEIAVKDAWSTTKLRDELAKVREMGIEPIPKLNFATTHDAWLGKYGRMVSSEPYYSVCRDLIEEVIDIFDKPRFFHLGMDEETYAHQIKTQKLVVLRQDDLWWHDFYFLVSEVERHSVRPWIWSDYGWHHPDQFFKKMPKSVLQSNWYYGSFDTDKISDRAKKYINFYNELEAHGYDQVPTGSNHSNDLNMEATVAYCKNAIDTDRLAGFMTAPWRPTLPVCFETLKEAISQIMTARNNY